MRGGRPEKGRFRGGERYFLLNGDRTETAIALGISRRTLQYKLQRFQKSATPFPDYNSAD